MMSARKSVFSRIVYLFVVVGTKIRAPQKALSFLSRQIGKKDSHFTQMGNVLQIKQGVFSQTHGMVDL